MNLRGNIDTLTLLSISIGTHMQMQRTAPTGIQLGRAVAEAGADLLPKATFSNLFLYTNTRPLSVIGHLRVNEMGGSPGWQAASNPQSRLSTDVTTLTATGWGEGGCCRG